jgi:hypothetical protein
VEGRLNSIGGRLILIETALSNVPAYMLSMFRIPRGCLKGVISIDLECFGEKNKG